ncbi:MAG: iron-siderophore ABC transporter substrate-binding protein [Flaviflexus sp.]|uniref:iron-siderophore ABC transporter substrate-binding protein n=1 Tax=Flaviflexus sp. TaxID=1969482 RepID=UPI003F8D9580
MTPRRLLAGFAAAALSISLAACSSDEETDTDSTTAAEETAGEDTGDGGDTTDGDTAETDAFPVTIEHVFGSTTIEEKPERVATVAWNNHEVPLALGVVPVGMERVSWGDDDDNGMLPWVEEALAELGGETPELFDATDGIPFETVANTNPDVILAAYSGLTQEEYDQLSKIAPVVAYPELAWGTSLEDTILVNSKALGLEEEGQQLVEELDAEIAAALENHPSLEGTKPVFAFIDNSDMSKIGVYTALDPRQGFLLDNGFGTASILDESADAETFYVEVSAENPEAFDDVDFLIAYGSDDPAENEASLEAWQGDALLSRIPAIAEGRVVFLGNGPLAAAANSSPLSVAWGIDDYFSLFEEALN